MPAKQENSMVIVDQFRMITPAGSIDDTVEQFKLYQELKEKLATKEDFQLIGKKNHPKKSFVRKIQRFFNLSCELLKDEPLKDENGKIIAWIATARAIHTPTGAYQDADGSCSFDEKAEKQRTIHNIRAHAITRAKNRAILDLVGFGEVSAEEVVGTENTDINSSNEPIEELTYEQAANLVVDFGKKYRGKKLSEVPENYIQWMMRQKDLPDKLKVACVVYLNGPEEGDTDLPFTMGDEKEEQQERTHCNSCGIEITKARAVLSQKKYGAPFCTNCKK